MNRREFVKALAGIPVLRLLTKLPKAKKGLNLDAFRGALVGLRDSAKAVVPRLQELAASCREIKDYGKLIFWDPYTEKGDDANDGRSPESPVATLSAAMDLADEGRPWDTVITFCESREGPRLIVKQEEMS